jgi:hypothetical protein
MLTSRTPRNRWEKGLRSEWRKGFATGSILILALFSHTVTETALAILWYVTG